MTTYVFDMSSFTTEYRHTISKWLRVLIEDRMSVGTVNWATNNDDLLVVAAHIVGAEEWWWHDLFKFLELEERD